MLGDLSRWLQAQLSASPNQVRNDARALRIASAALLVEAAGADHHFGTDEYAALVALLASRHGLAAGDAEALLTHARARSAQAVSLTELTQVVKTHTDEAGRRQILVDMWRVAFADGRIDKYEEYVIRQVAGLLYVTHVEYIQAREKARAEAGTGAPGTGTGGD